VFASASSSAVQIYLYWRTPEADDRSAHIFKLDQSQTPRERGTESSGSSPEHLQDVKTAELPQVAA